MLFVMGDFNAKVCRREPSAMSSAVGLYGLGETNEAGEQLEDFCLEHQMALANTMFKQHPRRISGKVPRQSCSWWPEKRLYPSSRKRKRNGYLMRLTQQSGKIEAKGRDKNRYKELKAEVQRKLTVDKQQQLEGICMNLEAANLKGNSRQLFRIVKSMTRKF